MRTIFLFIILLAIWLLLSGFFKPLFIFYGVSSCLISVFFFRKMLKIAEVETPSKAARYFSLSFFCYILWLVKEIIISTINVSIEMWREKPNVEPQLKWVKHNLKQDNSIAVYANSITLTPGTVSVYATDKEMLVHALHSDGIKDLESQVMHDKIKNSLEGK